MGKSRKKNKWGMKRRERGLLLRQWLQIFSCTACWGCGCLLQLSCTSWSSWPCLSAWYTISTRQSWWSHFWSQAQQSQSKKSMQFQLRIIYSHKRLLEFIFRTEYSVSTMGCNPIDTHAHSVRDRVASMKKSFRSSDWIAQKKREEDRLMNILS